MFVHPEPGVLRRDAAAAPAQVQQRVHVYARAAEADARPGAGGRVPPVRAAAARGKGGHGAAAQPVQHTAAVLADDARRHAALAVPAALPARQQHRRAEAGVVRAAAQPNSLHQQVPVPDSLVRFRCEIKITVG